MVSCLHFTTSTVLLNGLSSCGFKGITRFLYVSQPAISKQIAALEKEIGLTLVDRTYRNLRLTQSGEILRDTFGQMVSIYSAAINEAKRRNAQSKGKLAIGVPRGWIISELLPPSLMKKMRADYPEVIFYIQNLSNDDLRKGLLESSLDVIITHQLDDSEIENGSIVSSVIKELGLRLFCSNSRWTDIEGFNLEDFRDESFFVSLEAENIRNMERVTALCETLGFAPRVINMTNAESAISSVEAGLGVVVFDNLHKLNANKLFQSVELPLKVNICLSWRRKGYNPIAALFINELQLLMT